MHENQMANSCRRLFDYRMGIGVIYRIDITTVFIFSSESNESSGHYWLVFVTLPPCRGYRRTGLDLNQCNALMRSDKFDPVQVFYF